MVLYLSEIVSDPDDGSRVLDDIAAEVSAAGGVVIEFLVNRTGHRIFVVTESDRSDRLRGALELALQGRGHVDDGPVPVRLVGADLAELKTHTPKAGYLVEWDLPVELTMDDYLERKRVNSSRYADVPETRFLRTYVRKDLVKCVCLYDAPDEIYVHKARDAVQAPVDRVHSLRDVKPER